MSIVSYLIAAVARVLEIILVWRIQRGRFWRHYPFFSLYVAYAVLRAALLPLERWLYPGFYPLFYWKSDAVAVVLWGFITWELFRQTFGQFRSIRRIAAAALLFVLAVLAALYSVLGNEQGGTSIYLEIERKASFAQALLLLVSLLVARFYDVPLGRNMWGMAIGFGIFVSISTSNFAMFELRRSFLPYWQVIRPASFVAMLAVWTWAFWVYSPNPRFLRGSEKALNDSLVLWKEAWYRVWSTLRRIPRP